MKSIKNVVSKKNVTKKFLKYFIILYYTKHINRATMIFIIFNVDNVFEKLYNNIISLAYSHNDDV